MLVSEIIGGIVLVGFRLFLLNSVSGVVALVIFLLGAGYFQWKVFTKKED